MLRAEGDEVLALRDDHVVLTDRGHRGRALVEDARGVVAVHVVEVVRRLAAVDGDGRRRVDVSAGWVALPRGRGDVLGDAVRVLGGTALGGGVAAAGRGSGDVQQDE